MGIPFTRGMGFLLTATMGKLFTMTMGIQLTISKHVQVVQRPRLLSDNHRRYHEAIDNLTPADKYYGRDRVILKKREKVCQETMKMRRELSRLAMFQALPNAIN